jgi:DNA invertase Pin-like site-specific DNA recombinase
MPSSRVRAVGYVRRSHSRQEASLVDQKKAIRKYTKAHNIILEKFFEDVPRRNG